MDSIEYPIFNLSYPTWDIDTLGDFFLYNDRYKSNEDFFDTYYLNQDFIDCQGNTYRIIGKSLIESKFRIFRSKTYKIQFERLDKKVVLKELKRMLKEKTSQIESDAARSEILNQIEKSESIKELLNGF